MVLEETNQVRSEPARANRATGVVVLSDGTVFFGRGAGAVGSAVGEVCFNTAMTGYQEILTDPSYCEQIVCFTFPHIGNVGANPEDGEAASPAAAVAARAAILRAPITPPSNWRARVAFDAWLERAGIVAVSGVDTRALTHRLRDRGMAHGVVAHARDGVFDVPALVARARAWPGIEGAELARRVTADAPYPSSHQAWDSPVGAGTGAATPDAATLGAATPGAPLRVAVLDFGVKTSILARLNAVGAKVEVFPADTPATEVLATRPDGVVLANGPGDPAATAEYAAKEVRQLIDSGTPILGICLGHQLLALALGGATKKMRHGHHGANHPVQNLDTGAVAVVSMNHGFAVDPDSLPIGVTQTHRSLFDGTNCGLRVAGRPIISVQHHPEASPGPHDAFSVFEDFAELMRQDRVQRESALA